MKILKLKETGQFTIEISSDFKVLIFLNIQKPWLTHVKDMCYAILLKY